MPEQKPELAIGIQDVEAAAEALNGKAVRTALIENDELNERAGARVFVKPECLQVTGSFKFRGGYTRLANIPEGERHKGVVAWSSGNHAQGVAAAAARLGMHAAIVMPEDAPQIKINNTKRLGAEVIFYDRYSQSREAIGRQVAEERGAVLVPSYDDPYIMAGQGTAGLEIAEDLAARNILLDHMLVCCGGGGLTAGIATALSAHMPEAKVWTVEPEGFDDTVRSLKSGHRERVDPNARSICDALLAETPGHMTFPVVQRFVAGGLLVSEQDVIAAMRFAVEELKLVVEPGGAVALAALLAGKVDAVGKTIGLIISGGNVDPATHAALIAQAQK